MVPHFTDRTDAGQRLSVALKRVVEPDERPVVLALPRGGVPLGRADSFACPLSLVIAQKIGHPDNPEYAVGAVAERGEPVWDQEAGAALDPNWRTQAIGAARAEATRRHERYLSDHEQPEIAGHTAILVDDGIATGLTMRAAVRAVAARATKRTIVAAPVCPEDVRATLVSEVDDIVTLDVGQPYLGAVGAYYDHFSQLSDAEVVALLARR
ncbi:phosphoribosyl transferase [Patescibacteria group bacterium]|jgi:predicted phosphoribosyltransferase|nr:phosphoribosyl transferase [Patescibacteria group bacterium]